MIPQKPSYLIDSVVINNTVGANDETLAARKLTITGLGTPIELDKLVAYKATAYGTGTAQVRTLDFAACTFASGTLASLMIYRNDTGVMQKVGIAPTSSSTTAARTLFVAAINALGTHVTAAAGGGSTLTLTQNTDVGGFTVLYFPTGMTNVNTTPYVAASGSYAEVVQYDQNAMVGGQFQKYDFTVKKETQNPISSGFGTSEGHIVVWVEKNDAQFAAFNTALVNDLNASPITDAAVEPYVQVI